MPEERMLTLKKKSTNKSHSKKDEHLEKVPAHELLGKAAKNHMTADTSDVKLAEMVLLAHDTASELGLELVGPLDYLIDFRDSLRKVNKIDVPNDKQIEKYLHCGVCIKEGKPSNIEVGYTKVGWQVWCRTHNCNIVHIHFEGQIHPANTTRRASRAEILKIN